MSAVLEYFLIVNSILVSAYLLRAIQLIKLKIKAKEEQEHQKNLVAIGGLADVFALEDENGEL